MKVLIYGLGLNDGGVGSAKFFAQKGEQVRVTDLKSAEVLKTSLDQLKQFKNIKYTLGKHKYEDIDWADLIIKNPAVKPGNPYIEYALKKNKQVETDMGIFLQYVKPDQIIGITGTKGKSTTASLIYEILKKIKKNIILAGNIGRSVLDVIPHIKKDTLVVLELSSFQLQAFRKHHLAPKWAVVTNIFPDHLNYYENMGDYIEDKRAIAKYQTKNDFLFMRKGDPFSTKGKTIYFSKNNLPKNFKPKLVGEHNLENMAAALAVGKVFKINSNHLLKTLAGFKGIPFRLELVKNWQGFKIYNDSTATNPSATIEALKALGPANEREELNIILICGGMNKGMNYDELKEAIGSSTKAIYFLEGDVVDEIMCDLPDPSIIEGRFRNLETLLLKLKKDSQERSFYFKKGDVILFSPAATSFNLFQNEFDRGRKFNTAVEKVFGGDSA